jgi:hypothetical protein
MDERERDDQTKPDADQAELRRPDEAIKDLGPDEEKADRVTGGDTVKYMK